MDNRTWFKQAGYGMMAHWGLYSLLAGEYRGRRVNDYAECRCMTSFVPAIRLPCLKQYPRLLQC